MKRKLKTTVTHDKQEYIDKPIYRVISKATPMASHVASICKTPFHVGMTEMPKGGTTAFVPSAISVLERHQRVKLLWMVPGPDGCLVPRE